MDITELKCRMAERFGRAGRTLTDGQATAFASYAALLDRWNRKVNLTSIRDPDDIITAHFLDSALALDHIDVDEGAQLADVGTGAGFPGVPVGILRRDVRIDLFEPVRKKVAFLTVLTSQLGLSNVAVHPATLRPQSISDAWRGAFDGVLSRYTASLEWLIACARPLTKPGGWLLAHKYDDADEYATLERARASDGVASAEWIADERAVTRRRFARIVFEADVC